jgi:adenylate cyclase
MVEAAFKAVEIQPGDAEARACLGLFLIFGGRPLEAISHIETAMRLSPRFLGPYQLFFGYANALAGAHEAAIAAINDITPGAYSPGTFAFLMLAYFENGDLEKAKGTARFALERYPNAGAFDWITFALMRSEHRERLLRALTESGIAVERRGASDLDE